jgi:hypothetical protein
MRIVDITPEYEIPYFCCLEEWSDDMKEAGTAKQRWYEHMKGKGLRVKFALDDNGVIGGMIQYLPIEQSMYDGHDLYVVLCIWVHGISRVGATTVNAAWELPCCRPPRRIASTLGLGAGYLGLIIPAFMRVSWFRRHGYRVVDKSGIMRLMWKPFKEGAIPPKFIKRKKCPPRGAEKVNVTLFQSGWCQSQNISIERTIRAAREFEAKVNLEVIETNSRDVLNEWGISDGIFLDGKEVWTGPPLAYEKIRKKIERKVNKKHPCKAAYTTEPASSPKENPDEQNMGVCLRRALRGSSDR